MKKKILTIGLSICFGMVTLSGCNKEENEEKEDLYIGVTYYDQSDTFLNELVSCFEEEVKALREEGDTPLITMQGAGGSQRIQNDQVKEMIDGGCNLLCVNLVDRTDPSEIIDMAREADVPIIFFNREPVAEDMEQWEKLYYVGAKSKQSGILQGELAAEAIKKNPQIDRNHDGIIQYVVMEGEPGHQDTIIRTENAVETLKREGIELEKLSYGIANWNRAQAETRMTQMIGRFQSRIELVLANNDEMALGAIEAYKRLNYTEANLPIFFGIDGTQPGMEAVVDGDLAGTVYNDKEGQAKVMAKLASDLVSNKNLEKEEFENERYIYRSYKKMTSENVREFW